MKQVSELESAKDWYDYLTEMADDLRGRIDDGPQFKGRMKHYELDHTQLKNWYRIEHDMLDFVLKWRVRFEEDMKQGK